MPNFYSSIRFLSLVGAGLLAIAVSLRAGTTWDGGGGNNLWSTSGNWNPDGVPANNGTSALAFAGTTRLTPDMDTNWSINSLTFSSGAGAFTLGSTGAFTLTIQSGGITNSSTNTETISNAIALGAAQTWSATSGALSFGGNIANGGFLLTISGGSNTAASGVISGTGGLTKNGTGTLTLSGANTYTGTTTVGSSGGADGGTLRLSGSGAISNATTTLYGGTLDLNGTTQSITVLALGGGASGSTSVVTIGAGNLNLGNNITYSATNNPNGATISGVGGGKVNLLGNRIFTINDSTAAAADLTISAIIADGDATPRNLTKAGGGTLVLTGINTYTGTTQVGASGADNSTAGTLQLSGSGTISNANATVVAGTLDLNGTTQTITSLNVSAGSSLAGSTATVNIGSGGVLNLGGNVVYAAAVNNAPGVGTISGGTLNLNATRTFTVNDSTAVATDMLVSSIIANGGAASGLTKAGAGTLALSGANTYTGATTVSAGVLNIQNATGLGTTAAGTTVSSGATLQLQNSITVGAEALTISGTGASGQNGALVNVSGTNNYGGLLTLGAAATISSDSGTLNLTNTGTITGATFGLTLTGAGTGTVSSIIGTTSGSLTKSGAGTWTLSGNNTYTGGTIFNAGTISISSDTNLGASSGSLTFNGGTLKSTNDVVGSRAIIMTGAGVFSGTFGKTMEESGAVSGNGNLTVTGSGTLILSGSGSNGTGTTTLTSGVLSLRGTVSLGSGNLTLSGGLLELGNGDFTRALGVGVNQVNMNSASGGAGFAAFGADRIVNLGGSGGTVTWGAGNFVASGQPLYLGSSTADHMVDFQNPINLNGASRTVTVTDGVGTGIDAKISGAISGSGTSNLIISTVGFAPWNPGSLLLSNGNNSYAGTTTVTAGSLLLSANATGTAGNTVLGSGSSDILIGNTSGSFSAGLLTDAAVTIGRNLRAQSGNTGTISIGGYTADASTFSGNVFLGTNSVSGKGVTLTAASGGTVTFSGVIQDPTGVSSGFGLVTKNGAGIVVLSGANTYSGSTTANAGSLFVNGSTAAASAVTVNNSGTTLGGSGTINGSVNVASSGANLSPGASGVGSTAVLHTGALTLSSGSNFNVDLNNTTVGTGYDQANVAGSVTITASNLVVTAGPSLNIGDKFFILLNDSTDTVTGTFAQGATVTSSSNGDIFSINYTDNGDGGAFANDVSLTVTAVPEPATWIAGALAFAVLLCSQRRRLSRWLGRTG